MSRPMPITIICDTLRDVDMEEPTRFDSDQVSMPGMSRFTPTPSGSDGSSPPSSLLLSPASPQDQSILLRSPAEILHRVLTFSDDISSIAPAASTCKALRTFIYDNPDQALWRDLFLSRFDHPSHSGTGFVSEDGDGDGDGDGGGGRVEGRKVDWKKEVQDREFTLRVFRDWSEEKYPDLSNHVDRIVSALLQMYLDLPPIGDDENEGDTEAMNTPLLESALRSPAFTHLFNNYSNQSVKPLLRPLRGQPGNPNRRAQREILNPDLMRLHALLPPSCDHESAVDRQMRGWLRELVYTGNNYGEDNDWGPFKSDGTVNWSLVDAISFIMMSNARDVLAMDEDAWTMATKPLSYGIDAVRGKGFRNITRPPELDPGQVWDWAGVEGEWCGSYAFLDYSDWISLNEPRLLILHRRNNQLDLARYAEAVGDIMRLDLKIDQPSNDRNGSGSRDNEDLPVIITGIPTSNLLPPIKFHGSSHPRSSSPFQTGGSGGSFVRGVVQLTADNPPQVRWTLVIRYGGQDRWRLECVQVGGRGSKRGFFGTWTDAQREEHSPCGPVWYWPVIPDDPEAVSESGSGSDLTLDID